MNEMLDEMATAGMSIVRSSILKNYKNMDHLYNSSVTPEDVLKKCFGNPDFYFLYKMLDHSLAAMIKSESILFENIKGSVKKIMMLLLLAIFGDIIFYITSFLIAYKDIHTTNKILNELVNIIFIIPQSTINMIPQFKRFIETGSFEEE
ncbi:hypothetical protein BCR36DRAFT_586578 [Piromyces finnis]|uniref:Uncharacterized protein n=1 Tax=Piromyces finnis TaxID=1754191 RepID=A0A1Y1UYP9_9FUNG|nr:hypothetical protein BCR36DRAFT_586578 [Piromyces finnis]|eukprot:ORX43646.1 hypothetical protein BCR36DRAFT_586578 [Piromyces finnis]